MPVARLVISDQSDILDLTEVNLPSTFELRKGTNDVHYLHDPLKNWPCRSFVLSKNRASYIQIDVSFSENGGKLSPEFLFSRRDIRDGSIRLLSSVAKEDKLGLVELKGDASKNFWDLIACLSHCHNVDVTNFKRHKILESDKVLEINDKNLKDVVQQLIDRGYSENVLMEILEKDADLSGTFAKSALQEQRERDLEEFEGMMRENCGDEIGKWQPFFERCTWIFGLGLNYKFLPRVRRELKTGLGDENDKGQSFTDFGLGELDDYSVLVELKTPDAKIFMSSEGDSNTWKVHQKLANSLVQLLSQKTAWVSNAQNKFPIDPKCILVYGDTKEVDSDTKRMTFEMFRRDSRNVEIITYDELFKRAYYIVYQRQMSGNYLGS